MLFKKPSMDGFLHDLAGCKAIIANAGFSLVSEALYLGKPYLAVPVQHQFEQIFNAYFLDKEGYGAFWEELTKKSRVVSVQPACLSRESGHLYET